MKRVHLAVLVAAAAVVACSDSDFPSGPAAPALGPPAPAHTTISGRVLRDPTHQSGGALVLVQQDGSRIALAGDQTPWLESVIDADVSATGLIDANLQMVVESFLVLAIRGMDVSDGILEVDDNAAYGIRLTATGERREVMDPPEELRALVGRRVWIAGSDGEPPTAFGPIGDVNRLTDADRARW